MVAVGEIAPDFRLQADDGRQISLSDFKGKTVILYFYPKDETPGCTTEALGFREAADRFKKEGAVILGVSKDSVESHQKFKKKHGLPFTLLSDPEGKALKLYDVWKQKSFYGRTFMGTERTTFVIDGRGKVQKVYQKVTPKNHAQACLADLKSPPELSDLKLS